MLPQQPQVELRVDDLYTIIGELEVVRRSLNIQIQKYLVQIDEMSAEIARLREANGLVQTTITSNYITFVDEVKGRDVDAITLQNAALVNPPANSVKMVRLTAPQIKFQELISGAFVDKILAVEGGGTGSTTLAGIGSSMGLGTMAYQNANNVNITGGAIGPIALRGNSSYSGGMIQMTGVAGTPVMNIVGPPSSYAVQISGHGADGTPGGGLLIAAGNATGGDYALLVHSADYTFAPFIVVRKYAQAREGFIIPVGANKYVTG